MENLALYKIRLSVLWLVFELTGVVGVMLEFFEPGFIEQTIIAGEMAGMQITPEFMLGMAIIFLIPLFMAVLSLTLKEKANRWANIIVGIFITGFWLIGLIEELAEPSAYAILNFISAVVFSALIVWYAWKWPKQGA